ncbi:MAG: histidine kinase dimerization/phosphoacceptor domain -containing protein [Geminicoccaceae bacterium]
MPAADEAAKEAVIEASPTGPSEPEVTHQALQQRLRQQEILAELGVLALRGVPFPELLDHSACVVAEGMHTEFCKVLEFQPQANRFLVVAGVGWDASVIGRATIGADLESPSGFALRTGKPVISNHLEHEERFRTPELLIEHGIRRAMNVILQGEGHAYGVLEVDSREPGEFDEHDLAFLQGAANLLGMAIERQRIEAKLRDALKEREMLLAEVNHRVKNSLQLVASMLSLQAGSGAEERVRQQLLAASTRIAAIARAHQRLYRSDNIRCIDLSAYLVDLCHDLSAVRTDCAIVATTPEPVQIATDRAIPVALVVNELVTNAVKHGRQGDGEPCRVEVRLERAGPDEVVLSVSDDGAGLPPGFDPAKTTGLGMRIVLAFAQQLGATLEFGPSAKGAEFALRIPLRRGP